MNIQLIMMAAVVAGAASASAAVVRIRGHIVVDKGADVRLGELATVTGTGAAAERLANTVVLSGVTGTTKVQADAVLMAVASQLGAAATNDVELSGSMTCEVTIAGAAPAVQVVQPAKVVEAVAAEVPAEKPAETVAVKAAPAAPGDSLEKVINEKVLKACGGKPEDVEVLIETVNPAISAEVSGGRRWVVQPVMHEIIGTVPFNAQLVEGDKVVKQLTVSVHVRRMQHVVVLNSPMSRGDVAAAKDLTEQDVMLDRTMPTLFGASTDVSGLEAVKPVAANTPLDQRDFKQSMMVEKSDEMTVIVQNGEVRITRHGRANEAGKLNQAISVTTDGTKETYQALLIGKKLGIAGATPSAAEQDKLREEYR